MAGVIGAFDPTAEIDQGPLLSTPDGRRSVDIAVRSKDGKDGKPFLTAIDILYLSGGRKGDIAAVDAADSKRSDIKADAMLLCSNTGFEPEAISKAKRKKIGLISVLRQGDKRVKAVVEEQVYLRHISLVGDSTIRFDRDPPLSDLSYNENTLLYDGRSVANWLKMNAELIMAFNSRLAGIVTVQFRLRQSMPFEIGGKRVMIHRWEIQFKPQTQWLAQTIKIDAKALLYDYVRGRVKLAPGSNSYTISGVDFNKATPLSYAPEVQDFFVGLNPGEVDMALIYFQGWTINEGLPVADMDSLIVPTDIDPRKPNLLFTPLSH